MKKGLSKAIRQSKSITLKPEYKNTISSSAKSKCISTIKTYKKTKISLKIGHSLWNENYKFYIIWWTV